MTAFTALSRSPLSSRVAKTQKHVADLMPVDVIAVTLRLGARCPPRTRGATTFAEGLPFTALPRSPISRRVAKTQKHAADLVPVVARCDIAAWREMSASDSRCDDLC